MAIRGPQGPKAPPPEAKPALREQPASPTQRLLDFGAARTPAEAKKLVAELLTTLRAGGFPVPPAGTPDRQLGAALKEFQRSRGLPANGQLDQRTKDALVDAGVLPSRPDAASETDAGNVGRKAEAPARFEVDTRPPRAFGGDLGLPKGGGADTAAPTKSSQGVELEHLADRASQNRPPEVDLKAFLSSLRASGFTGAGQGASQLKDAIRKLQRTEGLPITGRIDAATAQALIRRQVVDEGALPVSARAPAADAASQSRDARADAKDATKDPAARGAQESAASDASAGRAAPTPGQSDGFEGAKASAASSQAAPGQDAPSSGERAAQAAQAGATGAQEGASAGGDVADPWRQGHDGNAPAGDRDVDDRRRGHTNVDDDDVHEEGHWEVRPLSEQIVEGLAALARDDDGTGAATYAWDFTLHRPGIYGAKQPAEVLFHLVVKEADAFAPLWEDARAALNEKLRVYEPAAPLVEREDIARALRIARVRERDVSDDA